MHAHTTQGGIEMPVGEVPFRVVVHPEIKVSGVRPRANDALKDVVSRFRIAHPIDQFTGGISGDASEEQRIGPFDITFQVTIQLVPERIQGFSLGQRWHAILT